MASSAAATVAAARRIIYLGMDVHKESITIAVLSGDATRGAVVDLALDRRACEAERPRRHAPKHGGVPKTGS